MRKLSELRANQVVQVTSKEESLSFRKLLNKANYTLRNGISYLDEDFEMSINSLVPNICIDIHQGYYDSAGFYKHEGYEILQASEFLEEECTIHSTDLNGLCFKCDKQTQNPHVITEGYPKKMLVWDYEENTKEVFYVLAELPKSDEKYLVCIDSFLFEKGQDYETSLYINAKEIPTKEQELENKITELEKELKELKKKRNLKNLKRKGNEILNNHIITIHNFTRST